MRSDRSGFLLAALAAALAVAATWTGCATGAARRLERAPLQHVVLIELADRAELPALRSESDRLIPAIPGVRGYLSGAHIDVGRANVASDYDLAIVVEFDSIDDYRRYLEHPAHLELVRTWKPKWRRATIYDFGADAR